MSERNWYRMSARASKDDALPVAEISLYDEVGLFGIRASDFVRDLRALGDLSEITLNVNSPGGEVFDGLAIHNVLARHPARITARIDGIAASIASVIVMAADEVVMPENALMMIHDPSGMVNGTADDMRELADALDKLKSSLISAYRAKSGLSDEEIAVLMAKETWLTAKEAKAKGFCDRILAPVKLAASASDLSRRFRNLPAALAAVAQPSESAEPVTETSEMTVKNPEAGASSAEAAVDVAKLTAEHRVELEKAKLDATAQERDRLTAIAAEIRDLCAIAGNPARALDFLAAATPVVDVRKALLEARVTAAAEPVSNQHVAPVATKPEAVAADWSKVFAREAKHRFNNIHRTAQ